MDAEGRKYTATVDISCTLSLAGCPLLAQHRPSRDHRRLDPSLHAAQHCGDTRASAGRLGARGNCRVGSCDRRRTDYSPNRATLRS